LAGSRLPNFLSVPDLTEPKQEKEKQATKVDALAKRPALAIAYHMPERNTPEYYAMGLIDQILIEGDDSLEYQELVQKRGMTAAVNGGINYLGNMFNYKGPMLFMADLNHDPATAPDAIVKAWDGSVESLRTKPVDKDATGRAQTALQSL
jgi:predicted Zn-dependent peptidase